MRLEGKVALISGGARGMGAVEARLFVSEGAKVGIADIREEEGRALEAEIKESGGDAMFISLDVTDEQQWSDAVDAVMTAYGRLDILVNNAGIFARHGGRDQCRRLGPHAGHQRQGCVSRDEGCRPCDARERRRLNH